jgi:hypothetical protein
MVLYNDYKIINNRIYYIYDTLKFEEETEININIYPRPLEAVSRSLFSFEVSDFLKSNQELLFVKPKFISTNFFISMLQVKNELFLISKNSFFNYDLNQTYLVDKLSDNENNIEYKKK